VRQNEGQPLSDCAQRPLHGLRKVWIAKGLLYYDCAWHRFSHRKAVPTDEHVRNKACLQDCFDRRYAAALTKRGVNNHQIRFVSSCRDHRVGFGSFDRTEGQLKTWQ
jgi:hypothetical protein